MKIELDINLNEVNKTIVNTALKGCRACLITELQDETVLNRFTKDNHLVFHKTTVQNQVRALDAGTIDFVNVRNIDAIRGRDYDYILIVTDYPLDLSVIRWVLAPCLLSSRGKCEFVKDGNLVNLFA